MRGVGVSTRVRGAALVEFALILPLLMLMLLGIMECGLMLMQQLTLEQAAREGLRVAAVRRPTGEVIDRIRNSASALPNEAEMQIALSYSLDNGRTYPYTLGNALGENTAPSGSLIRASVVVPHHLMTGSVLAGILGANNNSVPLQASVVMRRE